MTAQKIDWIALFLEDRMSITRIMRENTASDVLAGYSLGQIAHEMAEIQNYERETKFLLNKFKISENGQMLAYHHMKKVGAIA